MSGNATIEREVLEREPILDLAGYTTVEDFMQRVFRKDEMKATPTPLPDLEDALESAHQHTADLIEQASQTIDLLGSRCESLGLQLQRVQDRTAEQTRFIDSLKQVVTDLKVKTDALENSLRASSTRCETAEARVMSLEEYQKMVTLRAKRAEGISSKLQQQVEAAFGAGSPINSVMNAISLQDAAE